MPTEVRETIGSGGDYADISSWLSATASDLVSADEVRVGEIIDAAVFDEASTIDVAGATTDATRYRHLTAASDVRHNGTGDGSGARVPYTGGGHAFTVNEDHFHVSWMDFSYPSGGGSSDEIFRVNNTGFTAHHSIFHDVAHASGDAIYCGANGLTLYTYNCFFWDIQRMACLIQSFDNVTWYVYNCTGWNLALGTYGGFGFQGGVSGSVMVCKNVYSHAASTRPAFWSDPNDHQTVFAGSRNNISADTTAPVEVGMAQHNVSPADAAFVSLTAPVDLHVGPGSELLEDGFDLSSDPDLPITTDIDGQTRDEPWDVGADEETVTSDTTAPTLSSASASKDGSDGYSGSVDTDEGDGTLYHVVTQSSTAPSAAQVKAGEDDTGSAADASDSQSVTSTGTQSVGQTGVLSAETQYWIHYMHEDAAGNQSSVASSGSFTTDPSNVAGAVATGMNLDLLGG